MSASAPLQNDRLLRAVRFEPVDRVPVWMTGQASPALSEFETLDAGLTPEFACEATLRPLRRMDLDAAVLCADPLALPQAFGMEVEAGRGPHLASPLRTPADLGRLRLPDDALAALGHVTEALGLTRRELAGTVPLIGSADAPWTLMARMIGGGRPEGCDHAKGWLFAAPDASRALLETLTETVARFLCAQAEAGAQALQVSDAHAGALSPYLFNRFALPALARIAEAVKAAHPDVPLVVSAGGAHHALEGLAGTFCDAVGLDHTLDPADARARVEGRKALQGNLDPACLYASPEQIRKRVGRMLDGFDTMESGLRGYIANLGHDLLPDHDPAHAAAFVDAVHEMSAERIAEAVEG